MKRYLLFFSLLFLFSACKKDALNGYEISYLVNFEIDAGLPNFQEHYYTQFNIPTTFQAQLDARGYTLEQVNRVEAKFLNLDLISPSGASYNYLDRARLFISADGLPDIEIGYLEPVPSNVGNRISFIPNNPDLINYLKADNFNLILAIKPLFASPFTSFNRASISFQVLIDE